MASPGGFCCLHPCSCMENVQLVGVPGFFSVCGIETLPVLLLEPLQSSLCFRNELITHSPGVVCISVRKFD